MPDEHGRLLDELLELRSMAVAVQRSGEVIVRNHIFAISFSGLPHTVKGFCSRAGPSSTPAQLQRDSSVRLRMNLKRPYFDMALTQHTNMVVPTTIPHSDITLYGHAASDDACTRVEPRSPAVGVATAQTRQGSHTIYGPRWVRTGTR